MSTNNQCYVTFVENSEVEIIFQYLFSITICIQYGHKYIAMEDFQKNILPSGSIPIVKVTFKNMSDFEKGALSSSHIICEGAFQCRELYIPFRESLVDYLTKNTEGIIRGFASSQTTGEFTTRSLLSIVPGIPEYRTGDIVLSLRLEDTSASSDSRSSVVKPHCYTEILEKWFSLEGHNGGRLIIVLETASSHHWHHKYLEYFQKWSPILTENTAVIRECKDLIHSHSPLCWVLSFLSEKTHRFIPISPDEFRVYNGPSAVFPTETISKRILQRLNVMCDHRDLKSLPYGAPDELFVEKPLDISHKKYVISPLISSEFVNDPLFTSSLKEPHYHLYKQSLFASSNKNHGWDCLRHYEILANGCIPIIEHLDKCPLDTLTSLPKQLLLEAYKELLPWRNTEEQRRLYPIYCERLFQFAKDHCSLSALTRRFLRDMTHLKSYSDSRICAASATSYLSANMQEFPDAYCKNVLMLVCDSGVNYTRELTWIGLKRWANANGSEAVEWPAIDYLYDSFPEDRLCELYENGITYSMRLPANMKIEMSEPEIVESIQSRKWDMIIYGKMGPDELFTGSIPHLPFWEHVFKRYSRDEIVFWYGGDGMQDMTNANRYSDHLVRHCQYARCFVRELNSWDGKLQ